MPTLALGELLAATRAGPGPPAYEDDVLPVARSTVYRPVALVRAVKPVAGKEPRLRPGLDQLRFRQEEIPARAGDAAQASSTAARPVHRTT